MPRTNRIDFALICKSPKMQSKRFTENLRFCYDLLDRFIARLPHIHTHKLGTQ